MFVNGQLRLRPFFHISVYNSCINSLITKPALHKLKTLLLACHLATEQGAILFVTPRNIIVCKYKVAHFIKL